MRQYSEHYGVHADGRAEGLEGWPHAHANIGLQYYPRLSMSASMRHMRTVVRENLVGRIHQTMRPVDLTGRVNATSVLSVGTTQRKDRQ